MKKSILIGAALLSVATIGTVASSFAASGMNSNTASTTQKMGKMFGQGEGNRGMGGPMFEKLTETEQTALESMSDTEKKAFFEKKRAEMEAKRDAHEAVIDKLLAGTALMADEEKIRQEIISKRAEMKKERAEMEAKRKEIEAILAKKQAGTTLTSDEQALLDSMPKMGK